MHYYYKINLKDDQVLFTSFNIHMFFFILVIKGLELEIFQNIEEARKFEEENECAECAKIRHCKKLGISVKEYEHQKMVRIFGMFSGILLKLNNKYLIFKI